MVGVTVLVVGAGPEPVVVGFSVVEVVGFVGEVVGLSVFPQLANNITEVSTNKAKDFFIFSPFHCFFID